MGATEVRAPGRGPARSPLPAGLGVGWRRPVAGLQARLRPAFVEVLAENVDPARLEPELADVVASPVPVVTHGVSLSLGSARPPSPATLDMLNRVARACGSPLVSEHIALVRAEVPADLAGWDEPHADVLEAGHLLPVPLSRDQLEVTVDNVRRAQAVLERPLALEPIAALVEWPDPQMSEGAFVTELLERTDALLVLDIANVWANAVNHGRDPFEDCLAMPLERIAYCHIAGGTWIDGMYQDTHGDPVVAAVLDLARKVAAQVGPVPLMLERDSNFPPEAEHLAELDAIADAAGLARITP